MYFAIDVRGTVVNSQDITTLMIAANMKVIAKYRPEPRLKVAASARDNALAATFSADSERYGAGLFMLVAPISVDL